MSSTYDVLAEHLARGAYINTMMDEGQQRVQTAYRENYQRLVRTKTCYAPQNLFRVNQNIKPAGARHTITPAADLHCPDSDTVGMVPQLRRSGTD